MASLLGLPDSSKRVCAFSKHGRRLQHLQDLGAARRSDLLREPAPAPADTVPPAGPTERGRPPRDAPERSAGVVQPNRQSASLRAPRDRRAAIHEDSLQRRGPRLSNHPVLPQRCVQLVVSERGFIEGVCRDNAATAAARLAPVSREPGPPIAGASGPAYAGNIASAFSNATLASASRFCSTARLAPLKVGGRTLPHGALSGPGRDRGERGRESRPEPG